MQGRPLGRVTSARTTAMAMASGSRPSDLQGEHPLHAAAALGDVVAVRRMLAESVLPDEGLRGAGPGSSCTPLNLCCASELGDIRDREACVAALLKAGADPNHCSPVGPLYHALRFGRERILAMLIEAGGSVNGGNGLSPFVPAILRRLKRTYPYFLQAGAVIPTSDELRRISWGDDHNELQDPYLQKVLAAGSFANYAKAHRARLLAILAPKFPQLPKEMVSVVIGFWAHVGFY